jgi:hypothetical protein
MKLCKIIAALLLCWASVVSAQDYNDFKPLEASGAIPPSFIQLGQDKYESQLEELKKEKLEQKRYEKKAKKNFTLINSFEMKDFIFSGRVIFNDPLSQYITKVGNEVMKGTPELQGKLSFYIIRSTDVNAFSTHEGMIFVNEGILAELQNEAQLAYLLCHEIIHYKNKHVMNAYVENVKVERGDTEYGRVGSSKRFWAKNKYSRELEEEADQEGLNLFLKTKYSTATLPVFFDVLQYAYLPFDDIAFDRSYFETKSFKFPADFRLEALKPVTGREDIDEEKSTHPSVNKRRKYIIEKLKRKSEGEKSDFVVSESEFLKARKIARFDMLSVYLTDLDYVKAIYHAFLLQREEPKSLYLKKSIAKSLYGLAKYYNAGNKNSILPNYEKVEGKSQQLFYLFDRMDDKAMSALALHYCWALHTQYPDAKDITAITDDLFKELIAKHYESVTDFSSDYFDTSRAHVQIDESLSKYDKFNSAKDTSITESNYANFMFVDEIKDDLFYSRYEELTKQYRSKNKKLSDAEAKAERKAKKKEERMERRKGLALGIDKIVIVNPWYLEVDERKKNAEQYVKSENSELRFNNLLQENAKKIKLDVDLLNETNAQTMGIDEYNEYQFMRLWASEYATHNENKVKMVSLNYDYTQSIIKKHGTKYFSYTGVIGAREKKTGKGGMIVIGLLSVYMLPYAVYYVATPDYQSLYFHVTYDIESGEEKLSEGYNMNTKDTKQLLNMRVYDSFYQLKSKRRK